MLELPLPIPQGSASSVGFPGVTQVYQFVMFATKKYITNRLG